MKYGLTQDEWQAACAEIRARLIELARLRTTITYGDLTAQLTTIAAHPGSYVFHALLREVCYAEYEAGRGMLCALVVSKATGRPGQGFYKALIQRGYDCTDLEACWQAACAALYAYWGEAASEM